LDIVQAENMKLKVENSELSQKVLDKHEQE